MVKVNVDGKSIENIELFVFDKDGTIIDLYTYWSNMIALRAKRICNFYKLNYTKHKHNLMFEMGVDAENNRLRPKGPVGLLPRDVVQRAAESYLSTLNIHDTSDICFKVFEEADKASLFLLDKFIKPINGAIELLRDIKSKGARTAIATTDRTERARLAIDFLDISGLIDFIVGADKVERSKPAPDMLNLISSELGVEPHSSVMIGDAETDIQMGINASYKASIAVCSGLTSKKDLSELTPYLVEDISQIGIEKC